MKKLIILSMILYSLVLTFVLVQNRHRVRSQKITESARGRYPDTLAVDSSGLSGNIDPRNGRPSKGAAGSTEIQSEPSSPFSKNLSEPDKIENEFTLNLKTTMNSVDS